jgi:hypothetical protein
MPPQNKMSGYIMPVVAILHNEEIKDEKECFLCGTYIFQQVFL